MNQHDQRIIIIIILTILLLLLLLLLLIMIFENWVSYRFCHKDCAATGKTCCSFTDTGINWQLSQGGDDTVGHPHRSQNCQFELFELIISLKLDNKFSIEQFEPTVSQSTVSSPFLNYERRYQGWDHTSPPRPQKSKSKLSIRVVRAYCHKDCAATLRPITPGLRNIIYFSS